MCGAGQGRLALALPALPPGWVKRSMPGHLAQQSAPLRPLVCDAHTPHHGPRLWSGCDKAHTRPGGGAAPVPAPVAAAYTAGQTPRPRLSRRPCGMLSTPLPKR